MTQMPTKRTISHTMKISFLVLFYFFFLAGNACTATTSYWGDTGHRVVGEVAETYLKKKTKKRIAEILGNESLAMASTWADFVKSDPKLRKRTSPWHYVNIPDDSTYETMHKNPKGDIIEALDRMISDLKNPDTSKEKKIFALRFIVHLVGDLHQPLHAGRAEDLGGNRIEVKWFGRKSNLHRVWDSEMINSSRLSFTEFAGAINFPTKGQIKRWQSTDYRVWVAESNKIAKEVVYESAKNGDKLSYRYIYDHDTLLKSQLLKAGVRLAGLLNSIFA